MANRSRPLSPHLQIYKLPFAALLSISHRITGVLLVVGTSLLVYWLLSVAAGPKAYASAQTLLSSRLSIGLLLLWSAALFFHLFNGVRHLFWDAGRGFDLKTVDASGKAVVFATFAATVLTWIIVFNARGDA